MQVFHLIIGSIFKTGIIQEQNYLPGISNKIFSRFATIAVAYENMERFSTKKLF